MPLFNTSLHVALFTVILKKVKISGPKHKETSKAKQLTTVCAPLRDWLLRQSCARPLVSDPNFIA